MSTSPEALPQTTCIIEQGITEHLHPGAQLYVSLNGQPIADFALGEAQPGVPMTTDSLSKWLSAVKPICAVAIARLWEQGKLALDDPVSTYIPAFVQNGKNTVTLRYVLTHTAGLKHLDAETETWQTFVDEICDSELNPEWVPGRKAAYSVGAGWIVLAEIVRVIDGRHYDEYAREDILVPLGMHDSWISTSPERWEAYGERLSRIVNTAGDEPEPIPWDVADGDLYWPGGSGRGPIRELGRFYEMLLGGGERDGVRILSPQTVEAITARHRAGLFDDTFRQVVDWGLGFLLDSRSYHDRPYSYGYGDHSSPRAFGHAGFQCAAGFADPEYGLVVSWAFNGMPSESKHRTRNHLMNTAIYQDLGLA